MKKCIECANELEGRVDKIFCSPACKSSFHYKKNVIKEKGLYPKINAQLKFNRRVLSHFVKAGHAIVTKSTMVNVGFDPFYYTHQAKGSSEKIYSFCFEFGFYEEIENGHSKFLLEEWDQSECKL